jgi:hypothetical protein
MSVYCFGAMNRLIGGACLRTRLPNHKRGIGAKYCRSDSGIFVRSRTFVVLEYPVREHAVVDR